MVDCRNETEIYYSEVCLLIFKVIQNIKKDSDAMSDVILIRVKLKAEQQKTW